MTCTVELLDELGVAQMTLVGTVSGDELRSSAQALVTVLRRTGVRRVLADCRGLEGGHSVTDLYLLAEQLANDGMAFGVREAVLPPSSPDVSRHVDFWELTATNRGFTVRVCATRAEALAWLGEAPPPPSVTP